METKVLPKLRSLESILQPINRLPKDIFILIPRFFTREKGDSWEDYTYFPMNGSLVTMTHVCRSWRNVLFSTPSLWTQLDFSRSTNSQQAKDFLRRSGGLPLDIHQFLEDPDHIEPFLSTTLRNLSRLRRLDINLCLYDFERLLGRFLTSAPVLEDLKISNDANITEEDIKFPSTIFGGRLPRLTSLSLCSLRTDLRGLNLPSLTRFSFRTGTKTSVRNLTSFFQRCPLLEFIQICFDLYTPEPPTAPPKKRVHLAALKELRLDQTACKSGLLDHLILPKCTEMMLKGEFMGGIPDYHGSPTPQIHPSSIAHLPVTREITKAVAMPKSCILSGPNGNLRFWCFHGNRENFDAEFFTLFSPISALEIRELWVGQSTESYPSDSKPWKQTAAGVRSAFEVLTKVEDLTIVSCETEPFFVTLDAATDDGILLSRLRRLTIYVGCGDLAISALVQCAKARKERSKPLGEVAIIFGSKPQTKVVQVLESLREFVEKLDYCVGVAPILRQWESRDDEMW